MTRQVRTSYRNHRRAAWGLAVALVLAIAAVVIPIASAADKTFTLSVAPSPACSSTTDGIAFTVLKLKNTAGSQTLGSAEVYFPPNTVDRVLSPATVRKSETSTTSGGTKDIVAFSGLNLSPGSSVAATVYFRAGTFSATVNAVVKQSNNFNDTQGGANLFTVQGAFPTMRLINCVTVSGRVYQDRNLDNVYTTGTGAFLNSDVPKAWTVKLYVKDIGALASSYALVATTTSGDPNSQDPDARGRYTFAQVLTGSDYKICATALGTDASSKWGLQAPTGNAECGAISSAPNGPTTSAGRLLTPLGGAAVGQDFQVVPVVGPFGQNDTSTVGGYSVTAGANPGQKLDQLYVQDTWVDSQGRTNFRFSPILPCDSSQQDCTKKIYLLETLTADVALDKLAGQQATLLYDDQAPFLDLQLRAMPYCLKDPRSSQTPPFTLATADVLPPPVLPSDPQPTSCIVEGHQTVITGSKLHVAYNVYTAYDGGRQIG